MPKIQLSHHPIRAPRGTVVHAASPGVPDKTACGKASPGWVTAESELDCGKCKSELLKIRILGD